MKKRSCFVHLLIQRYTWDVVVEKVKSVIKIGFAEKNIKLDSFIGSSSQQKVHTLLNSLTLTLFLSIISLIFFPSLFSPISHTRDGVCMRAVQDFFFTMGIQSNIRSDWRTKTSSPYISIWIRDLSNFGKMASHVRLYHL